MDLTKPFYSPSEVARLLDLHSDTVLNYIRSGKLFAIRFSVRTHHIPRRAVQRLIAPDTVRAPRFTELRGDAAREALEDFEREISEEVEVARRGARRRTSSRG